MNRIAPLIAVVVLVVVAVFVFIYEGGNKAKTEVPLSQPAAISPGVAELSGLTPGVPKQGTSQVAPMMNAADGENKQVAPMLGDLVGRLEAKVKADPTNIGNQILLAQTYSELGRTDDGISILRKIPSGLTETPRVNVVLASLLSKSAERKDQDAALKLLEQASTADPKQAGFSALYKGRIYAAQGKPDAARRVWQEAVKKLPSGDAARPQIEDELAKLKQ